MLAVLLCLPVLYVGSYLALVEPPLATTSYNTRAFGASPYRNGKQWSERVFWPLEQIDRRLRPGAWESPWHEPIIRSGRLPFKQVP